MLKPRSLCALCRNAARSPTFAASAPREHERGRDDPHYSTSRGQRLLMKVQVRSERSSQTQADALAVGVFADDKAGAGSGKLPTSTAALIAEMRRSGEIRGREGEVHVV